MKIEHQLKTEEKEPYYFWLPLPGSAWFKCQNCGHHTMVESKFCPDCGVRNKRADEEGLLWESTDH